MIALRHTTPTRRREILLSRRLIEAIAALLAALSLVSCKPPQSQSLTGKLNVLVRPPDRAVEPISIEHPGAVPVQSGGAMCLDVQLTQPAYVYLVWFNSAGEIVPLYPWNNERLEITDIDEPPPTRRPGKLIFSPLLGKNWTFGSQAGDELVLLLARNSALPADFRLGSLVKALPSPPALESENNLLIGHANHQRPARTEAVSSYANSSQRRLADWLQPLTEHFDVIQAVQFRHENAASTSSP